MVGGLRGVAGALLLALVGALTALPAVAMHLRWWGLVVVLLAPAAFLVALPGGWPRVGFAAGWTAVVGLLSLPRPEGDHVVPGSVPGYALLAVTTAVVLVALVTVPARGVADDPGSVGSGT